MNSFTILNFTEETLVFKNGTETLEPSTNYKDFFLLFSDEDVLVLVDNERYRILANFVINKMENRSIKFTSYITNIEGITVMELSDFKKTYFYDQLVSLNTPPKQKPKLKDRIRDLISYIFCGRI